MLFFAMAVSNPEADNVTDRCFENGEWKTVKPTYHITASWHDKVGIIHTKILHNIPWWDTIHLKVGTQIVVKQAHDGYKFVRAVT